MAVEKREVALCPAGTARDAWIYFRSIRSGRTTAPCVCSRRSASCSHAVTRRLSLGLTAGVPHAAVTIVPSGSRAAATCRPISTVGHGLLSKRTALELTLDMETSSTLQLATGAHPFRGDDALARVPPSGCGLTDVSMFMSENESIPSDPTHTQHSLALQHSTAQDSSA